MEKAGFQMVKNPADNTRALKKSCFFPPVMLNEAKHLRLSAPWSEILRWRSA